MTLFHQTVANHPDAAPQRVPTDAKGWCEQASVCEESGDWTRAVVCYRRAIQLAPFSADLREKLEDAIEQQILEATRGGSKVRRVATGVAAAAAAPRKLARPVPPSVRKASANTLFKVEEEESRSDDEIETFDEFDDEDDELLLPRGIGSQRTQTKAATSPRRHTTFNGRPRSQRIIRIGAVLLAVSLTSAGLLAAAGTSQMIRGMFSGGSAVLEDKVPAEVREIINEANGLVDKSQVVDAIKLIESGKLKYPRNTVELNRVLAGIYRRQGDAAMRDKKYETAAKSFSAAVAAEPEDFGAWISRGRALREHARTLTGSKNTTKRRAALSDSLEAFETARDLSPAHVSAYLGIAQVQEARANKAKAVEAYQKIVSVAPESNEARLAKDAIEQLLKN
ncbi:tetratricopeptide repeat protein [Candidatus Sumerlaeota bacterium]|nr:tetratricopeptide repeat protein [Candidatus Sumerlaeota bacterium]